MPVIFGSHSYCSHFDERGGFSTVHVGNYTSIGPNAWFDTGAQHHTDFITTSPLNSFFDSCSHLKAGVVQPFSRGDTKIGSDVWVGERVMIMSGVTIGDGAVVGSGAIVTKDIPPYAVACGNPAKVIRYRFEPEIVKLLLKLKWWEWPENVIRDNAPVLMSTDIHKICEIAKMSIEESVEFTYHKYKETLAAIQAIVSKKETGAYLRFGDGDVQLAYSTGELYQEADSNLAQEMKEAFLLNGPNILKSLPLGCSKYGGLEEHMSPGNHECPPAWCDSIVSRSKPLWGGPMSDVYSPNALSYGASVDPRGTIDFLRAIGQVNTIFVGNENINKELITRIFPNLKFFIGTPSKNSYKSINIVHSELCLKIQELGDYTLIVSCMGCSGRILQKRVLNKFKEVFLFDFGSLMDALCGWDTRAWIGLSGFNKELFFKELDAIV